MPRNLYLVTWSEVSLEDIGCNVLQTSVHSTLESANQAAKEAFDQAKVDHADDEWDDPMDFGGGTDKKTVFRYIDGVFQNVECGGDEDVGHWEENAAYGYDAKGYFTASFGSFTWSGDITVQRVPLRGPDITKIPEDRYSSDEELENVDNEKVMKSMKLEE